MRLTERQLHKSKKDSKLHVVKITEDDFGVMMEVDEDYIVIKTKFLSDRQAKDFIIKLRTAVVRENYELFQKNNENG